jgi:hypothetical protein
MFRRRSTTVIPTLRNPNANLQIENKYRMCLKLILAALIPLMIGVFTIVTTT